MGTWYTSTQHRTRVRNVQEVLHLDHQLGPPHLFREKGTDAAADALWGWGGESHSVGTSSSARCFLPYVPDGMPCMPWSAAAAAPPGASDGRVGVGERLAAVAARGNDAARG